ncbi:FecCD family ABC transporter permease [Umezakia ovalisporum]|jgi:iron complex transport system permease protein|uniref:FecCD family ABC transporter permease n=1 Tax=Umezakia ovalisporum TaxID=75695 RepID=UPI0006F00312|nr:iron ABC transporter permease [Umezakia ovalisporum]MBI1240480.1 iron chelate uptake ABC transporter family permease subunit [Nostoc sp. RI_552]MDH6086418.1 iron ABC transporter permease [Umezakia ovalisporum TAC611]MDH6087031.1 iron ABC transporter permease [Umezakia ovalisporum Ak1311]CEJ42425.1 ABC-type Fe3+-siderophore transport system, perme ase component (Iron(III) dicitrate transport system permeas e protein) [Umezakia ovalisporum]
MIKSTSSLDRGFVQSLTWPIGGLVLGLLILLTCLIFSVTLGAADIPLDSVYAALTSFDDSKDHLIIRTVRLPRSLLAIIVGAAISVSGALMQGITRNPLAEPGILGINAGASLAVVIAIFIFGTPALNIYIWYAFAGAGITAVSVYFLASLGRGGITPLNLTIAGAAISALLTSLITTILIVSQRTLEEIRFWLAGSLAAADASIITQVLPYICIGLILAFLLSRQITILSLGEDIAQGLGQQTLWIKIAAALSVFLLQGSAIAVTGGIGFIGLIVPHLVRFLVGIDYRWILPYSAIFGSILLLISDIFARLVIRPQEIPVGIMTALVGAPFFIYLAKSNLKK